MPRKCHGDTEARSNENGTEKRDEEPDRFFSRSGFLFSPFSLWLCFRGCWLREPSGSKGKDGRAEAAAEKSGLHDLGRRRELRDSSANLAPLRTGGAAETLAH